MTDPSAPTSTSISPAASSKTRKLDVAAGGDEVPAGPLGGPVFKTNDELNAERLKAEHERAVAEAEAAGVPPPEAPENPLQ